MCFHGLGVTEHLQGTEGVMALINRPGYAELAEGGLVDVAISPRTAIANAVLRYVRGGDISSVTTFLEGEAEILELIVKEGSLADGTVIVVGGSTERDKIVGVQNIHSWTLNGTT